MILGLGNDIMDVARIKRQLRDDGEAFKHEIFTPAEIEYCDSKRYPERHYAARFAAKEALSKALGSGIADGIAWTEIEIVNDPDGRPRMRLDGKARAAVDKLRVARVLVSLSHTSQWALASVILES